MPPGDHSSASPVNVQNTEHATGPTAWKYSQQLQSEKRRASTPGFCNDFSLSAPLFLASLGRAKNWAHIGLRIKS